MKNRTATVLTILIAAAIMIAVAFLAPSEPGAQGAQMTPSDPAAPSMVPAAVQAAAVADMAGR